MAFEPKRLTHPEGKLGDVVATTATDYSNFRFRDGYVVAEDQSDLEGDAELGTVGDEVDSEKPAPPATPKRSGAKETADKGKATNDQGQTVQTA